MHFTNKRHTFDKNKTENFSKMNYTKPSVANKIVDERGIEYKSVRSLAKSLGIYKEPILYKFRNGEPFEYDGHTYTLADGFVPQETQLPDANDPKLSEEYSQFLETKKVQELPFEVYKFKFSKHDSGHRYAVALFSDAHIEETVEPDSVIGLNEYNIDIAKKRIERYFVNLASCLNEDRVDDLIFASLGDTISGYIHDELAQTNGLSPLQATELAENLVYSGLKFLCENTQLKTIKFIGIVGNHSRTTKRIQHSNGYAMSYEWLMYRNIKKQCELTGLPIEFCLPNSEMAIVDTQDKKRFVFIHGFQIRSNGSGTVCGIYPALNRLAMKWSKTFKQDKIYLGHFHTCVSIPNAVVNGSIIGYNAFAMTNGFEFEEPAQQYEVFDTNIGQLLSRKIYCK